MPIVWRYLLRGYFQVFFLCVVGFISILLVIRFQDIARFAATGAPLGYIVLFILYQIPFILPLAIPISCLIGAILLLQKLSRSQELTALRASGFGLLPIVLPLLLTGFFLSLFNFALVSEIAPKCRALSKSLAFEMTAANPLCLLGKDALIKLKHSYIDMRQLKSGKEAKDVLLVQRHLTHERLGLMLAKELGFESGDLVGKRVTFISSIQPKTLDSSSMADHLVLEHQQEMRIKATDLLQYLRSADWHLDEDYLTLRAILAKEKAEKGGFSFRDRSSQEVARRLSLGLAAFTFTLLGLSFGMEIGRSRKWKGLAWAIGFAALYMVCYVAGKSMKHSPTGAHLCYLSPHLLIFLFSLFYLKKFARGWE